MISASGTPEVFHSAAREAVFLLVISLLLGLSYNGITGKGIFDPRHRARPASTSNVQAPEIIPLERAQTLFASGAVFIDSRHAYDFELGHITGAFSIPLKSADDDIAALTVPRDRTLVVYCDGADCNSSLEIGSKLSLAGFTSVKIFFSGWQAWKQAGLETEGGRK